MIRKILIANRGEIALRIQRAAKVLDIKTVAIFMQGEESALHVVEADESVSLGGGDLNQTYLNIEKIIFLAKQRNVDAIHPGYGFLSENPNFAQACLNNNITFVGPSADVLQLMGNKIIAKNTAKNAGVPVLESFKINPSELDNVSKNLPYPVMLKAAQGGGGKGMFVIQNENELRTKAQVAARSAASYFGDDQIYVEKFVAEARHIEVQVLGDTFGNIIHLYERDCSIQRNHQKIIEEAPATGISDVVRKKLHQAALDIVSGIGYFNAGTVEFLVGQNDEFYFLEMNPRIQVEHCVTEEITGVDLVKQQLLIAGGEKLGFSQDDITVTGHAIQARLYQEDPENDFQPSSKQIQFFQFPKEIDLRIESDLQLSDSSVVQFDPLLAKFIVKAPNRKQALMHLSCSLTGAYVDGPKTNIAYLNAILNHPAFYKNTVSTAFCQFEHDILIDHVRHSKNQVDVAVLLASSIIYSLTDEKSDKNSVWKSMGYWRLDKKVELGYKNKSYPVEYEFKDDTFKMKVNRFEEEFKVEHLHPNYLILKVAGNYEFVTLIPSAKGIKKLGYNGFVYEVKCLDLLDSYPEFELNQTNQELDNDVIASPLHGKIVSLNVSNNQTVDKGDVLMIIESMKSENLIKAPRKAKIKSITVEVGSQVTDRMPLVYLNSDKTVAE